MSNSHAKTANESFSTKQSNAEQVWEQLDLFEWAGLTDESCVGFAVRNGL